MRSMVDVGLTKGQIVAGRFRIEGVIGQGGMGTVYRACHLTLPREVAIKVLKGRYTEDPTFVERFRREAIAASQVVHPNVVYITDFGQLDDHSYYIVMEYLEGIGLDDVIESSGAQPLSRLLPILIQLADALDYSASVGVVHRDIKPENIMLCEIRGRSDVVKLVDFGISKILEPEYAKKRITLSGQIFGTPEYISPEGAMDLAVDGRSDIYSLGVIAYELATGEAPFTGEAAEVLQMHVQQPPPTPSARMPRQPIPPGFDGVVLRCLAKKPDRRYQTAAALCRDLLKLRGQLAGMATGLLDRDRAEHHHASSRVVTTGEWSTLDAPRDAVFTTFDASLGEERQPPAPREPSDHALSLAVSSRDLRDELHNTLKELAFSLGEAAIRSKELSEVLHELLALEEEAQSLQGQISVLEQNFERIRFEAGEQETTLRYALMDLKLLRSRLIERQQDAPTDERIAQIEDLSFQIDALDSRLSQVMDDKKSRIRRLNEEIQDYRDALDEREEQSARLYTELHMVVETVRPRAPGAALARLYDQLDQLSDVLQLARKSVRLIQRT